MRANFKYFFESMQNCNCALHLNHFAILMAMSTSSKGLMHYFGRDTQTHFSRSTRSPQATLVQPSDRVAPKNFSPGCTVIGRPSNTPKSVQKSTSAPLKIIDDKVKRIDSVETHTSANDNHRSANSDSEWTHVTKSKPSQKTNSRSGRTRRGRTSRRDRRKPKVNEKMSSTTHSGHSSAHDDRFKYKTEECVHWMNYGRCKFGNKCLFVHGDEGKRSRLRCKRFRTETCSDPARTSCKSCCYIKRNQNRCNFAHPGDAVRCEMPQDYYDDEYDAIIAEAFPETQYPFGIYL